MGKGYFLASCKVLDCKVLDGLFWMECVGHDINDGKCWAVVKTWKVLGKTYTVVDFCPLMESVGQQLKYGKCWALVEVWKVLGIS